MKIDVMSRIESLKRETEKQNERRKAKAKARVETPQDDPKPPEIENVDTEPEIESPEPVSNEPTPDIPKSVPAATGNTRAECFLERATQHGNIAFIHPLGLKDSLKAAGYDLNEKTASQILAEIASKPPAGYRVVPYTSKGQYEKRARPDSGFWTLEKTEVKSDEH